MGAAGSHCRAKVRNGGQMARAEGAEVQVYSITIERGIFQKYYIWKSQRNIYNLETVSKRLLLHRLV